VGLVDSVWRGWQRLAEDTRAELEELPILGRLDAFEIPLLV